MLSKGTMTKILIITLISLLSFSIVETKANTEHQVPSLLHKFEKELKIASPNSDPDLEEGFPVTTYKTPGSYMGGPRISARVGNIDDDQSLEILFTGIAQGPLYAWKSDGSIVPGWPVNIYNRTHYTSLGNLVDQDPGLEVFTGQYVHQVPTAPPGIMAVFTGSGSILSGWPKDAHNGSDIGGAASLADIDGDGIDEIFILEDSIFAYKSDGSVLSGWPVEANSEPAIADLDGDGDLEIVAVIDRDYYGANLGAFHHDGSPIPNFSVRFDPIGQVYPVIGDVDGDKSPEIIVLSRTPRVYPNLWITVISSDGIVERSIPIDARLSDYCQPDLSDAPALADLDGDSIPEIIIGLGGALLAVHGDGTLLSGFPVVWGGCERDPGHNAPVVGDVDGDQQPDIVFSNWLIVESRNRGEVYVFNSSGELHPNFPKIIDMDRGATPALADIDLDGRNEIIIAGDYWNGFSGNYDTIWVYDLGGEQHGNIEWGQLGGGPRNQGYYPPPPSHIPDVDLLVDVPPIIGVSPYEFASIPIQYENLGATLATSVTLTVTLDNQLFYIDDTSSITPEISGNEITWHLPPLAYYYRKNFSVTVQLPNGVEYGDYFPLLVQITSNGLENNPDDNIASSRLMVVRKIFLPLLSK